MQTMVLLDIRSRGLSIYFITDSSSSLTHFSSLIHVLDKSRDTLGMKQFEKDRRSQGKD
jgi:hypothetical protein